MRNQEKLLVISSSPHRHASNSVPSAMRDVLIALTPAFLLSLYYFRLKALLVVITCVVAAAIAEMICQKLMKKEVTLCDNSAIVTGVLLAFCLPPGFPLWMAALGAVVSIVIAKQFFGGLGFNIFNPALIGRAFLVASWPLAMTTWLSPHDAVTTATPLGLLKEGAAQQLPSLLDAFTGNIAGSLGETSVIALLIGGAYLLYKGHIDWRIPFTYIGTVFIITAIIGFSKGEGISYPLFHIFTGGLMLGAIFMATDWVTSPITKKGRIIFGICCGLLTVLIRLKGGYPEGVCYSILLMNILTPLIDRYTKNRVFGRVKRHA